MVFHSIIHHIYTYSLLIKEKPVRVTSATYRSLWKYLFSPPENKSVKSMISEGKVEAIRQSSLHFDQETDLVNDIKQFHSNAR